MVRLILTEEKLKELGCAKDKCAKVLAELDSKKGYGLIEKKRQGMYFIKKRVFLCDIRNIREPFFLL